jgi:toxin ParE1/3/4
VNPKRVIPRQQALDDTNEAIDHYLVEAGADVALQFIAALEQAYGFIAESAAAGSPRWAHELNLPGIQSWPLKHFPWIVFYLELEDRIDVWRVLHSKRDIPAWLSEPELDQ